MLQSQKNEQTVRILENLRKQGMPSGATASGKNTAAIGEWNTEVPEEEPQGMNGEVTDFSTPGSTMSRERLRKKKRMESLGLEGGSARQPEEDEGAS